MDFQLLDDLARAIDVKDKYTRLTADTEQWPHCDPRVLHSFKTCTYCDKFEWLQDLRLALHIPFTNELAVTDPLLPWEERTVESANKWGGNLAY